MLRGHFGGVWETICGARIEPGSAVCKASTLTLILYSSSSLIFKIQARSSSGERPIDTSLPTVVGLIRGLVFRS